MYVSQKFFIIFCIFLFGQFTTINGQNNTNQTATREHNVKMSYVKHLVGFIIKDYIKHNIIITEKIVGAIIKGGFVLTNVAWDLNDKNRRYELVGDLLKKRRIIGFGGELTFSEHHNDTAYNEAVSVYNWQQHITQNINTVPSVKYVANTPVGKQLTIIVPGNNLLKKNNVAAIKLAQQKPKENVKCVIMTYGKLGQDKTYRASAINVKIMPKAYCRKELCEYKDDICVTDLSSTTQNITQSVNGGEPLICNDELWGIIRGGDIQSNALPAASIYKNFVWIRKQMRYRKKFIKDNWTKSNSYQLSFSTVLLLTTIIFIFLLHSQFCTFAFICIN